MIRAFYEHNAEGLKLARLLLVLSSFSPVFLLWAIRGTSLVPDWIFVSCCLALVIIPNACLIARVWLSQKQKDRKEIIVGATEDHRDHVLVYLFALVLPFYSEDIESWRALSATIAALIFILFLFWYLNLHYMNIVFTALGFQVYSVHPPTTANEMSGKEKFVLITWRRRLNEGERIVAYRLSNTVFWEVRT